MSLELQPIEWEEACVFIDGVHRHHKKPVGWKFGIAVNNGNKVVGVATVGRPVARPLDNGVTLEVNRVATDGTKNACSFLYGASWRAAKSLGYKRLVTYTLNTEPGTSLIAAGWKLLYETKGGSWDTPSRRRVDTHPMQGKFLWEAQP